MNNSKKMTEIIEKKKELSQEKTPKYGTRKLSIGLVSCMLGFSLIIAPGSSKAAEASENETVATETNTPEENPVEEATPVANEEIKKEETKEEVVEQAQEVVAKQADTFVEKLEAIEVEEGEEIDYKEAVTNLPQDAKLDVITPVDTKEAGEKTTSAKITFADGSVKEIQIKVNVKAVEAIEEAQDLEFSENVERQPVKAPKSPSTGVRDAAPPEDTTTSSDAKNAVHGYVGVLVGGDVNSDLKAEKGQRFKPIEGVRVYFQWYEKKGNRVSPVYSAVSDANGEFHMGIKPYIGDDGQLVKFDADTTVSAGNESYKLWVDESTIPAGYQLQYSTGEGLEFTDRKVAGGKYSLANNTLYDYRVLLMKKQDEEKMHKEATPTGPWISSTGQGAVWGKVSWDYESAGGVQWGIVSTPTSPAEGVTVTASYLSDYALKQIYSEKTAAMLGLRSYKEIRGAGWTMKLETQLQEWIAKQVAADKERWIAETVSAKTNAEGDYKIQFKGTWGPKWNNYSVAEYTREAGKYYAGDAHKWTEEEANRLGTVAEKAEDGGFLTGALDWNEKHINSDWLFISTKGTDNVVLRTPWNYNWYTGSNNAWGIHGGWAQAAFGVSTVQPAHSIRADFNLAAAEIKFNITNYDSDKNTASPGDVAKTNTQGLPYKSSSDSFRIVWYDSKGNEVKSEAVQKPNSTGGLAEATFDTKDVKETTTFTAKLYRVDSKGNNGQLLAQDSFTVKISKVLVSAYDEVNIENPAAKDDSMAGAKYSAEGLPEGLTINPDNGTISGKAKKPGKYTYTVKTTLYDKDLGENIEASSTYDAVVTDSPLKDGNVGKEYNTTVKPSPIDGYVFKNVTAKFIDGKAIGGLTIKDGVISGKPTSKVGATQDDPNVEVTYDIYKVNEKGEEILIKKGHVDRVPLSIKEVQEVETADKVQPGYTDADAQVGKPTTITAPNFKDDKGQDTTKPEGTKFALGKDAPEGAKIDENTGKITYTPTEDKAGQDVKIPVVVTYKDGSTDEVKANVTVAALDDIIDRTGNEDKPTPKGYVRVTFEAGEGVDPLQGAKVYDVKEGTILTADKYPTVTAKDGYENPTWSTTPGTAITAENAKITAKATKKEETSAKPVIDDVTEGDKIISGKGVAGSDIVVMRGKDLILKTKVNDDGTWSVKVPDGKTLKKGQKIVVKQTEKDKKPATENTTVKEKAPVVKPEAPTLKANDDGSVTVTPPTDKDVDVVQITYTDENNHEGTLAVTKDAKGQWKLPDGTDKSITIDTTTGVVTIPANQVKDGSEVKAIAQKGTEVSEEAKVNAKNNPVTKTDAEKNPAVAPEKTEVADKTALTPEEKAEVEKKVKEKNPKAEKVEVGNDGSVTLTYPDKSTNTLTPEQTVTEKAKTDAEKNPVKDPVKTEVENKDKLTEEEKAKVVEEVKKANPEAKDVTVDDKGNVTLTYPDGSTNTLPAEKTVTDKKATNPDKTIADKTNPTVPSKTEVKDKNNLTDDEKDKVKKAIEDANKDKFPQGTKVEIGKDGTATITYPDGSVDIIKGNDLVIQKAKAGASGSINRVNSSNTGKNVKTGVGSSATILATLAAAVGGLFASKKRKNEEN